MKVADNEVKLKLDLGALKIVQEITGKNFFAMKEGDFDPVMYSALLFACAKRGGSNLTQEAIDKLDMNELMEVQAELDEMLKDFQPEGKPVKNKKPQS